MVSEAPSRRHVVVLGEELSQVDNGSTGANLRLEAIDESSHVLNELTLAFTESQLLILDIINLVLICLDKFLVSLREYCKRCLFLCLGLATIAIHLRLDKAVLNLLKL